MAAFSAGNFVTSPSVLFFPETKAATNDIYELQSGKTYVIEGTIRDIGTACSIVLDGYSVK